jgi:hypothetical protein
MDDWAKGYSTLTDQQLLALIREPETLRYEARAALETEIRKRGLGPGAEAPPLDRPGDGWRLQPAVGGRLGEAFGLPLAHRGLSGALGAQVRGLSQEECEG